jgi:hypothetical protein
MEEVEARWLLVCGSGAAWGSVMLLSMWKCAVVGPSHDDIGVCQDEACLTQGFLQKKSHCYALPLSNCIFAIAIFTAF